MLQSENAHVIIFQRPAKKVQGEHIKSKVHKISVDKTAANKTIILMPHTDRRGPEDKGIHKPGIGERC
jgi:hypothetical protein